MSAGSLSADTRQKAHFTGAPTVRPAKINEAATLDQSEIGDASQRRRQRQEAQRRKTADIRALRSARARRRDRPRREPLPAGVYPERFSQHRVRIVSMLRAWESTRVRPRKRDTYAVSTFLGQVARRAVRPMVLPELTLERPRRALLLGLVTLACCIRRAKAVRGSRADWGELLGCCARTAYSDLEYCVDGQWLEKLPQFKRHKSHGRHGEVLHHRQLENWYRPGRKLREAWDRYLKAQVAGREAGGRKAGPDVPQGVGQVYVDPDGKSYQASALGLPKQEPLPPPNAKVIHRETPNASDAVSDGKKVSPPATVDLGPAVPATNGAAVGGERAAAGGQRADQEKPAQRRAAVQESRRKYIVTDDDLRLFEHAGDVMTVRALRRFCDHEPEWADTAKRLARILTHSQGQADAEERA